MAGFDIERWVKASVEKSGVPIKVSESSTLMSIASQLTTNKRPKKRKDKAA